MCLKLQTALLKVEYATIPPAHVSTWILFWTYNCSISFRTISYHWELFVGSGWNSITVLKILRFFHCFGNVTDIETIAIHQATRGSTHKPCSSGIFLQPRWPLSSSWRWGQQGVIFLKLCAYWIYKCETIFVPPTSMWCSWWSSL